MNSAQSIFGRLDEIRATLRIDGQADDAFSVLSFEGTEKLSEVFSYQVTVISSAEVASGLDDALGRDVQLTLARSSDSDSKHIVHGMVEEVCPSGVAAGKKQRQTTLLIVPRLFELGHTQASRVFQNLTVVDMARALFAAWQIELEARMSPEPLKRDYCTQVNENDIEFLLRILSEEGIHYHIEHNDKKATVILVNDSRGYQPMDGNAVLPYRDAGGALTSDHIKSIVRERRVRAGSVVYRDYNFLRPTRDMSARKENDAPNAMGSLAARELYEYPGHYNDPDGESLGVGDEVQGPTQSGKARAKLRLEEQRSDAFTFSGTTNCLRMRVGRTFEINDHPDAAFNRKYVITGIELRGEGAGAPGLEALGKGEVSSGTGVTLRFWAAPAEAPIRPKVRGKPKAHLRTARVVGPKEDEPYVDEYGRIKIQFAWDREGKSDEHSSCWVRMMTPVAHHNQGMYTAHRVGAEVVVDFLDGDIDRPVVIGALYNEDNRQPQKLPDDATRGVVYKGLSVPGNKGNNEISCEDRSGKEEILVHAQRDLNTRTLRHHSENVGANQSSSIGANQSVSVGANQSVSVGANRTVNVKGDENIHIINSRHEFVDDGESVTITGGRSHTVATKDDVLTVASGHRSVTVQESDNLSAKSGKVVIKETFDLNAGTSVSLHHQKDATLMLMENLASLTTGGQVSIVGKSDTVSIGYGTIALTAVDEIRLTCGAASLSLKKDGTISMTGATEVGLGCKSSTLKLEPASATVNGSSVNVTASSELDLSGALIKIN